MNDINLRELFRRVENGDREAFETIYRELSTPICTICYRITQSREAAEDIAHDVFMKLYSAPPDPSVGNLRAWIFQMARNLSIDALRKNARSAGPEEPAHTGDDFARIQARMDLESAFRKLAPEEREILTLYLNADLKFQEISRILGLSLAATYRKYRKALKKIQTELNGG